MRIKELIAVLGDFDAEIETNIGNISLTPARQTKSVKNGYVASGRDDLPYRSVRTGQLAAESEAVEVVNVPDTLWLE